MFEDADPITAEAVERLAGRLGIDAPDAEGIRAGIEAALDGYATIDPGGAAHAPTVERALDVTVDPGPDADPHNAFISRFELDGGDGPLVGLDVAIKDNTAVAGAPMTCGSEVFADAVPASDAAVVSRLLDAGATLVGKANMDELAYGPTGETSAFGAPENPAAPGRVTGGSSAGSAAAVAGGDADAALGTDTGGSVRIPAAFCGLVGVKPTWGRVPTDGVVDLAPSLDHVGPLAPDLDTAARVLDAIADAPRDDAGSFADAVADPPDPGSLAVGLPGAFYGEHVSEPVDRAVRERVDALRAAGATVREVSLPLLDRAVPVWNAIVNAEFAAVLGAGCTALFGRDRIDAAWHRDTVDGMADGSRAFGPVVRRKAVEGRYLLDERRGADYVAARNRRVALAEGFAGALDGLDALVTPTMPTEPVETGAWSPDSYSSGASEVPPLAVNTRPANLAGVPAVTLPVEGGTHPIGLQLIGAAGGDRALLGVAAAVAGL
jgi:amidase/aspartyl-tRNA(Asn)/glutamyl-tRNA(Gln) amidotransferase subunit A